MMPRVPTSIMANWGMFMPGIADPTASITGITAVTWAVMLANM